MSIDLCVPILHGVELVSPQGFATDFIVGVNSHLNHPGRVAFEPVYYHDVFVEKEKALWASLEHLTSWYDPLGKKERQLACFLLSQVLWYGLTKRTTSNEDIYYLIHQRVSKKLQDFVSAYPVAKFVLFGHSLGSQVVLDAVFENPETPIIGLYTAGSPIQYFSGKYPDWGQPPPSVLWWTNYFMRRDTISTDFINHPNRRFSNLVRDVEIKSLNPMNHLTLLKAHTHYWSSDQVHLDMAEKINSILT